MDVVIRPATADDQETIKELIRSAHLNQRGLDWERFLVAELDGEVVGTRQVKVHSAGTREIASGLVVPEHRHQGISEMLMNIVISSQAAPLYLLCDRVWTPYYRRFGFEEVAAASLPPDFRREYRIGRLITGLLSLFRSHRVHIVPMFRERQSDSH